MEAIPPDSRPSGRGLAAHPVFKTGRAGMPLTWNVAPARNSRARHVSEQAYILLSTAPIEVRYSGLMDIPNACCSVYVPTEIFEQDVYPS
jgi:Acetamidase/Formamidase family